MLAGPPISMTVGQNLHGSPEQTKPRLSRSLPRMGVGAWSGWWVLLFLVPLTQLCPPVAARSRCRWPSTSCRLPRHPHRPSSPLHRRPSTAPSRLPLRWPPARPPPHPTRPHRPLHLLAPTLLPRHRLAPWDLRWHPHPLRRDPPPSPPRRRTRHRHRPPPWSPANRKSR